MWSLLAQGLGFKWFRGGGVSQDCFSGFKEALGALCFCCGLVEGCLNWFGLVFRPLDYTL